jgi:uncharacterized LabA/DUF88 family protein
MSNIAYVDGQNLYMATTKAENPWRINLARFRIYLKQKYAVDKAYYYLGYVQDTARAEELYDEIQTAGFILVFRQHSAAMIGKKKGNVDTDIVFSIMKRIYKEENFDKIVLVSGDGDYKMLVDFLIEENKFQKILLPDRKSASSLYKQLGNTYRVYLNQEGIRNKIATGDNEERGALGN